jgi:hypothetical protein
MMVADVLNKEEAREEAALESAAFTEREADTLASSLHHSALPRPSDPTVPVVPANAQVAHIKRLEQRLNDFDSLMANIQRRVQHLEAARRDHRRQVARLRHAVLGVLVLLIASTALALAFGVRLFQ